MNLTADILVNLSASIAGKQKLQSKASSRKSKSPNPVQAYSAGERPSSVSSVHSEGDYHRQAPTWAWEDRPSSTGERLDCVLLDEVVLLVTFVEN